MDEVFMQMRRAREEYESEYATMPTRKGATDVKKTPMKYTQWLNRRGFFRDDLQCDFEHQIETFINDFNN